MGDRKAKRPSQAAQLIEIGFGMKFFRSDSGKIWASFEIDGHRETHPLRSSTFESLLVTMCMDATGEAPSAQSLATAKQTFMGEAYRAKKFPVYTRIADGCGWAYLDLADDDWRAVAIRPGSWEIETSPPLHFHRPAGMLALPEPKHDGSLDPLQSFLNIRGDDDWILIQAWLVGALNPCGPYPVLMLHGEQGSAKSTTARMLRRLIDPNAADPRSEPRDVRDLVLAANNGWILNLDNLSRITPEMSDALCRLATGGGFATRRLFTDDEEFLTNVQRPVILNGIGEVVVRPDLLDRCLSVELSPIPDDRRRPESELWAAFDKARPYILGRLLDCASTALLNSANPIRRPLPRMADFAKWVIAASPALGFSEDAFLDAMSRSKREAVEVALEASQVTTPLLKLVEHMEWKGTAAKLLEDLQKYAPPGTLPRSPRTLSDALKRLAPSLRGGKGIEVRFFRATSHDRSRTIQIGRPAASASISSASSDLRSVPDDPDDVDDSDWRDSDALA